MEGTFRYLDQYGLTSNFQAYFQTPVRVMVAGDAAADSLRASAGPVEAAAAALVGELRAARDFVMVAPEDVDGLPRTSAVADMCFKRTNAALTAAEDALATAKSALARHREATLRGILVGVLPEIHPPPPPPPALGPLP